MVLLLVVCGAAETDTVDADVVFLSACVDVVVLFVLMGSVPESVDAEMVLKAVDVAVVLLLVVIGAVKAETVDDEFESKYFLVYHFFQFIEIFFKIHS